jgi:hypothetical protein
MRIATLALAAALAVPATWTFEKDEAGKPPAGFELVTTAKTPAGKWEVRQDGDAKVLAQLDAGDLSSRFAMAIAREGSYKDLRLSVRGKPVSGKKDQAVGLVWRYKDPDNYYVARSNVLEQNVNVYRVVNGKRKEISGKDYVDLKTGAWHTLKVEQKGAAIAVFLGDQKILELEDKTFPDAGKVGVWIKADSVTYFDDLSVEELK